MLVVGNNHQTQHMDMKGVLGRVRNMSGGSTGSMESDLSRSWGSSNSSVDLQKDMAKSQWKQQLGQMLQQNPRALSETSSEGNAVQQQNKQILNPGRYKTEMCRPFAETGHCKYGEKCQFAHGAQEMRGLPRHPKYKTELCRTFHTTGLCPYGPRCHFIHSEDERRLVEINQMKQQQAAKEVADMHAKNKLLEAQLSAILQMNSLTMFPGATSTPIVHPTQPIPGPALPQYNYLLGSTADTPPESPVGSITDENFLHQSPEPTFQQHFEFMQPPPAAAAVSMPSRTPPNAAASVLDAGLTSGASRLPVFSKLAQ